jgi:hypothetical protein
MTDTHSLSNMYAIQKTRFRCSISADSSPDEGELFLCKPRLCANRIAAATKKKDGCGFGVPIRNIDLKG